MSEFGLPGNSPQGLNIQGGTVLKKDAGSFTVRFNQRYNAVPVVMLTPLWAGQGASVGHVETLSEVTTEGFTFASNNHGGNYFVMWLAVGE